MDPEKYIDEITDSIMLEVEHGTFHEMWDKLRHPTRKKIQDKAKDAMIDRHDDITTHNIQTIDSLLDAFELYKGAVVSSYRSGLPIKDTEIDWLDQQAGTIDTLIRSIEDPEFKSRRDGDRSQWVIDK
jgi:hypothetical protein